MPTDDFLRDSTGQSLGQKQCRYIQFYWENASKINIFIKI